MRTHTRIIKRFHYVWNEWFKSLDEIAADPRCLVDKSTFLERLELWPIEQAVKKIPDWHPDDIEGRCSKETLRKRLRQGFPPELALNKSIKGRDLLLYALNIPEKQYFEVYNQVARELSSFKRCIETFKVIGVPVAYTTFYKRLRDNWEVKVAALCNFLYIVFGEKYKSRADIRAKCPWAHITNHSFYRSLEEMIVC